MIPRPPEVQLTDEQWSRLPQYVQGEVNLLAVDLRCTRKEAKAAYYRGKNS